MSLKTPPLPLPRRAGLGDLDALVNLEDKVFDYDQLKRSSFRRFILSNNDLWVYEIDHMLLAYILVLKRKGSKKARIYSLAVSPESRGQGLGKKLLIHAMEELHGFDSIHLEVKVDNEGAINLYKDFNFKEVGRLPAFYSDGADAFVLEKLLK